VRAALDPLGSREFETAGLNLRTFGYKLIPLLAKVKQTSAQEWEEEGILTQVKQC